MALINRQVKESSNPQFEKDGKMDAKWAKRKRWKLLCAHVKEQLEKAKDVGQQSSMTEASDFEMFSDGQIESLQKLMSFPPKPHLMNDSLNSKSRMIYSI